MVSVTQIFFLSDYVAVLDSTGKIKGGAICKSSSKSPLLVYSRRAASILLHSSGEGANNGKGFRLRFRTIDWEPSGCGDPKKYVLASNDPIHISYVFCSLYKFFYFIGLIFTYYGFLVLAFEIKRVEFSLKDAWLRTCLN